MAEKAKAIAIVRITKIEKVSVKIGDWTYQQKASATVEQAVKGELPSSVVFYGDEQIPTTDTIHKPCRFAVGRYLVFLDLDGDLWTGNNWELSVHPITGDFVDWMVEDDMFKKKQATLDGVLKGIAHILARDAAQRRLVAEQLEKFKNGDPEKDLQAAWDKGDLRFMGVYGITLFTPGVEWGKDDGLVSLVGVNGIKGTSDFVQSKEQGELNNVAWQYAERYNALLLAKLKVSKTTNPIIIELYRQIERELQTFETADPTADFRRNARAGDWRLLYMTDSGLDGINDTDFSEIKTENLRYKGFQGNKWTLTKEQYARMRRGVKRYVAPYNKMMFAFLQARDRALAKKQAAHNDALMDKFRTDVSRQRRNPGQHTSRQIRLHPKEGRASKEQNLP